MDFHLQFPLPYLIIPVVLSVAGAVLLYLKEKNFSATNGKPAFLLPLLSSLRFLSLLILFTLLLSPFIRTKRTEIHKPVILIAVDQSASVGKDLKNQSSFFLNEIKSIREKLSAIYEIEEYRIDEHFSPGLSDRFDGKATNLSHAIEECNERLFNRNAAAIILASDGMYNQGTDPYYEAEQISCPIYTIGLGDTTWRKDIAIGQIRHNKTVALNDEIGIEVSLYADFFNGTNSQVQIFHLNGDEPKIPVNSLPLVISQNSFRKTATIFLPAKRTGVQHYRFVVPVQPGENNTANNIRDVYFEVVDARQKILVWGGAPHPDLSAIKQTLEKNQNYSVTIKLGNDKPAEWKEYNLIVFHGLPSVGQNLQSILSDRDFQKIPRFFWITSQTYLPALNKIQPLLEIQPKGGMNASQAGINTNFTLFTLSDKLKSKLPSFPPLQTFFGDYQTLQKSNVLLNQELYNIQTGYPLWLFDEMYAPRTAILTGEGYWRWRLFDYQQHESFEITEEILQKSIQYLSEIKDNRPFLVKPSRMIFYENEPVEFTGVLKNASGEKVSQTDVALRISNTAGEYFDYAMQPKENEYVLNAGFLPAGSYRYKASCKLGNMNYQSEGQFTIRPLELEALSTRADHNLLYRLSELRNGTFYNMQNLNSLADDILKKNPGKALMTDIFKTQSALEIPGILIFLLALLGTEWFLRKYYGGY